MKQDYKKRISKQIAFLLFSMKIYRSIILQKRFLKQLKDKYDLIFKKILYILASGYEKGNN